MIKLLFSFLLSTAYAQSAPPHPAPGPSSSAINEAAQSIAAQIGNLSISNANLAAQLKECQMRSLDAHVPDSGGAKP
jgi:hypothetical protein